MQVCSVVGKLAQGRDEGQVDAQAQLCSQPWVSRPVSSTPDTGLLPWAARGVVMALKSLNIICYVESWSH